MATSRTPSGWKNTMAVEEAEAEAEEEEEDEDEELGFAEDDKKKRAVTVSSRSGGGGRSTLSRCQADDCNADLTKARPYHHRHKVCEFHAKAPVVLLAGSDQRFCQQCSRFHVISEFDETKRSCRRRLAGHNERRRKSLLDYHGQTSTQ